MMLTFEPVNVKLDGIGCTGTLFTAVQLGRPQITSEYKEKFAQSVEHDYHLDQRHYTNPNRLKIEIQSEKYARNSNPLVL